MLSGHSHAKSAFKALQDNQNYFRPNARYSQESGTNKSKSRERSFVMGGTQTPLTFNYEEKKKSGYLDDPYPIEGEKIDLESISNRELSRIDVNSMKQRSYTHMNPKRPRKYKTSSILENTF